MSSIESLHGENFFRAHIRKEVFSADTRLVVMTILIVMGIVIFTPSLLSFVALPAAIVLVLWLNTKTTMSFYRQRIGRRRNNPYAVQYSITKRCPIGFHRAMIIVTKKTI